jgi:hypothetical protein
MAYHRAIQTDQFGYTQTAYMEMKTSPNAQEKDAFVAEVGVCPLRHVCITCSLRIHYTTHSQDAQVLNTLDVLLHEGAFDLNVYNTPYHPSIDQWMRPILNDLMARNNFRIQALSDNTHNLGASAH